MSIELKPCPFCGSTAIAREFIEGSFKRWFVECNDSTGGCFMPCTLMHKGQEEAAAQWNKRGAA